MTKLFVSFVQMSSTNFYLTLNVIDILVSGANIGMLEIKPFVVINSASSAMLFYLNIALFVSAIIALVMYITKKYLRTKAHMAYMVVRLFVSIISFLVVSMALVAVVKNMANTHNDAASTLLVYLVLMFLYDLLSLYWSYQLMKIVN